MESTTDFQSFSARLREFISCSAGRDPEERLFNSLALDLFALQQRLNEPYRRFCQARGVVPQEISHWTHIPAVPTAAFKELDLTCLPEQGRTRVFHSSGTSNQRPSRHIHNPASLSIYEASAWQWFQAHLIRPYPRPARLFVLTPSPQDAPHSSLAWMFGTMLREMAKAGFLISTAALARCQNATDDGKLLQQFAGPTSADAAFFGRLDAEGNWALDAEGVINSLRQSTMQDEPVVILGTAFLFVHLLEQLGDRRLQFNLSPGSRAMETGGYKGRSREMSKPELHGLITQTLGIPATHIISEYGMSELSSQAYDNVRPQDFGTTRPQDHKTTGPRLAPRVFRFPRWAQVQVTSPETGKEVREGETGLIRVFDLANVYSVMAIQTEDLGVRRGSGFDLIGRAALAEPRGCSLMAP
ncbi:MAG: hypothetical protein C5B50_11780 [Verrucomicrobia bacterium]|nr:MAG: hypothetical protein C5B50_11780 [Verrucomicrobiota bacterium]